VLFSLTSSRCPVSGTPLGMALVPSRPRDKKKPASDKIRLLRLINYLFRPSLFPELTVFKVFAKTLTHLDYLRSIFFVFYHLTSR